MGNVLKLLEPVSEELMISEKKVALIFNRVVITAEHSHNSDKTYCE